MYDNHKIAFSLPNIASMYIALWCLYFLQGVLYTSGGIVSRGILFFLMAVSAVMFFYSNIVYRLPVVLYILDVLIGIFTIYGVIYWTSGEQNILGLSSFSYLKGIYMSLLPIYSFFTFTRKGWLAEHSLKFWAFIFLGVAIVCFFDYQRQEFEMLAAGSSQDGVTNNIGYVMVALLPLSALFRRKPSVQYLFLVVCLAFILFAMKRGAILTGLFCTMWLLYKSFSTASRRGKFVVVILSILLLSILSYGVIYLFNSNEYFKYRIEETLEGSSSNRDFIYRNAIYYLQNISSSKVLLFGKGANSTITILGNYAHNDWLEILINNGIITAIVYSIYWISLFGLCIKKRKQSFVFIVLTAYFIIGFTETLYSMSYDSIPIYMSSIVGFAMAQPANERIKVLASR